MARSPLRGYEKAFVGCLLVVGAPLLLLGEAALLYLAAMFHVERRYDQLGFIDGGGAEGGEETLQLWFWLMLLALLIQSAAATWLVRRLRKRRPL